MRRSLFLFSFLIFSALAGAQPIIQWQKVLGGSGGDAANSIALTDDGGYIVAGRTQSNNGDFAGSIGLGSGVVVKFSDSGQIQWQKLLGGPGRETANAIEQTSDGGYILAGGSFEVDSIVPGTYSLSNFWVVKLDPTGEVEWQRVLGGSRHDEAYSIKETPDGGYIVAGVTLSNDVDVSENRGGADVWVVKLATGGEIEWQKCLGGTKEDHAQSIQLTNDGGYILAGHSYSNDGDVTAVALNDNVWVVKLSDSGDIQWQRTYGGSLSDRALCISLCSDNGYVVAGRTSSFDGDVSGYRGNGDAWIIKLTETGDIQWQKCLGGTSFEASSSVQQTLDGGFIIAGSTASANVDVSHNWGFVDAWIVKLNPFGALVVWEKTFGGTRMEQAYSVRETPDGGYIVVGFSESDDGDVPFNHGSWDFWVFKLFFPNSAITGRVHFDPEGDCQPDDAETGLVGWLVTASAPQSYHALTDAGGRFFIPVNIGTYVLNLSDPSLYFEACTPSIPVVVGSGDTISIDIPTQAVIDCPYLTVDITTPFLRRCFDNTLHGSLLQLRLHLVPKMLMWKSVD
jgi:hypothetical protein